MNGINFSVLLPAASIALAFSSWPIVARYFAVPNMWAIVIVLAFSTIGGCMFALPQVSRIALPTIEGMLWLAAASIANGLALYFYTIGVSNKDVPVGSFILVMLVMMVVWSALLTHFCLGDKLTTLQWVGVASSVITISLLGSK